MLLYLSVSILGVCCANKGGERVPGTASGEGGGDCGAEG